MHAAKCAARIEFVVAQLAALHLGEICRVRDAVPVRRLRGLPLPAAANGALCASLSA
jgi:hypothetical protein